MRDMIAKIWKALDRQSREEVQTSIPLLVKLLLKAGRILGIDGILRHYKWREVAMADILKHTVLSKTSSGKGGDATTSEGKTAEYKTGKISKARFLKEQQRGYYDFSLVYNGAYGKERILSYSGYEHFFGFFSDDTEECLLIYKADSSTIVKKLLENDQARKPGATTNLNTVKLHIEVNDPGIIYTAKIK